MVVKSDAQKIKDAVIDSEEIEEKKPKAKKSEEKEEPKIIDLPGVGPGSAAKLEAAGIFDLMGLAVLSPSQLSGVAGLSEAVARKAIQAARKMMNLGFSDAFEYAKKRKEIYNITTGSKNWIIFWVEKGLRRNQ